jgi:tetratricopeptide (TPR) repeat protein
LVKILLLSDLSPVSDLLSGKIDHVTCQACGAAQDRPPVVAVLSFLENRYFLYTQDIDHAALETITAFLQRAAQLWVSTPVTTTSLTNLNALKTSLCHVAQHHIRKLMKVATKPPKKRDTLARKWKVLQGEAMSITRVALVHPLFGVMIGFSSTDSTDENKADFLHYLGILQGHFWEAASVGRLVPSDRALPLEELIVRCVDSAPAVDIAFTTYTHRMKRMFEIVDSDPKYQRPEALASRYTAEAVNAAIHYRYEKPNPRARHWCSTLVQAELITQIAPHSPILDDRLRVTAARARSTISLTEARNAMSTLVLENTKHQIEELMGEHGGVDLSNFIPNVAAALGRSHLSDDLIDLVYWFPEITDEYLPTVIDHLIERQRIAGFVGAALSRLAADAVAQRDQGRIARFVDALLNHPNLLPSSRADVLEWFGARMKEYGLPTAGLAKIGLQPADWENQLSSHEAIGLANERSNLLRLLGRPTEALAENERALSLLDGTENSRDRHVLHRNRAVFLREVGRIPEALALLDKLLQNAIGNDRAGLLENLGATLLRLGKHTDAATAFKEARETLSGRDRSLRGPALIGLELMARVATDNWSAASALLSEIPHNSAIPSEILPALAESLVHLPAEYLPSTLGKSQVDAQLRASMEAALTNGNILSGSMLLRFIALRTSRTNYVAAEELWRRDLALSQDHGMTTDPTTLLGLATVSILNKQYVNASLYIDALAPAIASLAGYAAAALSSIDWFKNLDWQFSALLNAAIERDLPYEIIQQVADCQRNLLQRAYAINVSVDVGGDVTDDQFVPESCLPHIHEGQGRIAVLEWIGVWEPKCAMLTKLSSDGVQRMILDIPRVDFTVLQTDLTFRLECWHSARTDDPFDLSDFRLLESWFNEFIQPELRDVAHLVIIDHSSMANLPIHVIVEGITTSYTSHWRAIKSALGCSVLPQKRSKIGSIYVPTTNESQPVRDAIVESLACDKLIESKIGVSVTTIEGPLADRQALIDLLGCVEILKIVCHGHASTATGETALVLASGGNLPPRASAFFDTSAAQDYRFGWSAAMGIKRAPSNLFLGVCSAGAANVHGHQERMGLFAPLSAAGTRAIVAARWKIDASIAIPMLDETIYNWMAGAPLCTALALARVNAIRKGAPNWQAEALVVEGAWQ